MQQPNLDAAAAGPTPPAQVTDCRSHVNFETLCECANGKQFHFYHHFVTDGTFLYAFRQGHFARLDLRIREPCWKTMCRVPFSSSVRITMIFRKKLICVEDWGWVRHYIPVTNRWTHWDEAPDPIERLFGNKIVTPINENDFLILGYGENRPVVLRYGRHAHQSRSGWHIVTTLPQLPVVPSRTPRECFQVFGAMKLDQVIIIALKKEMDLCFLVMFLEQQDLVWRIFRMPSPGFNPGWISYVQQDKMILIGNTKIVKRLDFYAALAYYLLPFIAQMRVPDALLPHIFAYGNNTPGISGLNFDILMARPDLMLYKKRPSEQQHEESEHPADLGTAPLNYHAKQHKEEPPTVDLETAVYVDRTPTDDSGTAVNQG